MSHVDEANDYRLATDGAVEVAAPEAPCGDCVFARMWLADARRLQDALKEDAVSLAEIVEWCRQQEDDHATQ
jgi:hypothetical protein